jgi:hypothetical protein
MTVNARIKCLFRILRDGEWRYDAKKRISTLYNMSNRAPNFFYQMHYDQEINRDGRLHKRRVLETENSSFARSFILLPRLSRHLPGGGVEAIEEVSCGDHENQGREPLLVVVLGGLVPDLVGDRVRPIG